MQSSRLNSRAEIEANVTRALARLSESERELIIQMYFLGRSFDEISRRTNRQRHRLAAIHHRTVLKLQRCLAGFVARRFELHVPLAHCPICLSPYREEIDLMIVNRDRSRTWKAVMDEIRWRYRLDIRAPQRLIGHERYHMLAE